MPFPWDTIEHEGFKIATIDKCAVEHLLPTEKSFPKAIALAYLIASSRAGNSSSDFSPDELKKTWGDGAPLLLSHIALGKNQLEGMQAVSLHNGRYYLQKNFVLEQKCLNEWNRLKNATPLHILKEGPLELTTSLTDEQRQACELGCKSVVFILTGGPGTGKTYTAGRLLSLLQNSQATNSKNFDQIALAAPTGKAALTLEKSLGNIFEGKAKTLHALLGVRSDGSFPERAMLPYDIILVDEASMIDMQLMAHLLSSIKTGAKLILMGDPFQLPPVDGAPIFPLLVKMHAAKGELTRCLRAETSGLVDFAEAIRTNQSLKINDSVKLLESLDLEEVLKSYLNRFPKQCNTPEEWLTAFQKFRILTPMKVGPAGSIAVNRWIAKHLPKEGLHAIPLMITANDYRMELFNGEVGVLMTYEKEIPDIFSESDYVYFPSGKKIPALLLPPYELAYAMTVHKSQGSEFDEVLLLLPEAAGAISTPLLYTAVTRARKSISIWGKINQN